MSFLFVSALGTFMARFVTNMADNNFVWWIGIIVSSGGITYLVILKFSSAIRDLCPSLPQVKQVGTLACGFGLGIQRVITVFQCYSHLFGFFKALQYYFEFTKC